MFKHTTSPVLAGLIVLGSIVGLVAVTAVLLWMFCMAIFVLSLFTDSVGAPGLVVEKGLQFWWLVLLTPLAGFAKTKTMANLFDWMLEVLL